MYGLHSKCWDHAAYSLLSSPCTGIFVSPWTPHCGQHEWCRRWRGKTLPPEQWAHILHLGTDHSLCTRLLTNCGPAHSQSDIPHSRQTGTDMYVECLHFSCLLRPTSDLYCTSQLLKLYTLQQHACLHYTCTCTCTCSLWFCHNFTYYCTCM